MAGLKPENSLTAGRAKALVDDLEGIVLVQGQRRGARNRALEWLDVIGREEIQRDPDGLPPVQARALLDAVNGGVPLAEFSSDARAALDWVRAVAGMPAREGGT